MKTPDRWSLHVILKGNLDQDLLAYSLNSSPGPKPIMHYGSSFYEFIEVKWGFLLLYSQERKAKKEKPKRKETASVTSVLSSLSPPLFACLIVPGERPTLNSPYSAFIF